MNAPPPPPTLMATASDWHLFRVAMGEACTVSETEFRRLAMPARLRHLIVKAGAEGIVAEINAALERLGASYLYGQHGLDCVIQPDCRGVTLVWLAKPYGDLSVRTIDPCRVLPSLIRLEKRIEANPDDFDFHDRCNRVRRIITRTNSGT